jgi:hypothetical protein
LQLFQHLLNRQSFEYVFYRSRQDGKHGEGAVFLILFEPAAEAGSKV